MRLSSFLLLTALCVSAPAGELLTPGEQVLAELGAALAGNRTDQAVRLLAEVGPLYRYPASAVEAKALLELAARAARSPTEEIANAAFRAIGACGAAEGAPLLKPYLREKDPRVLAAVQAAGRLPHESLLAPLLDLAKSAANMTVADQSFFALAAFGDAPLELRKRVMERTLGLCQSIQRDRRRWRRLRAPALRSLQRLMGRRLNSVQQFADWWKFVKGSRDPFAVR